MKETAGSTGEKILDSAERLVQSRGFNAFSYSDVTSEVGITNASLHYHFPGKAALGQALIKRYATRFDGALQDIDDQGGHALTKLKAYAELYASVMRQQRLCLCGMLAADFDTLPEPMRVEVVKFFNDNQTWLANLLERGKEEGDIKFDGSAVDQAQLLISALEGAMLVARSYHDASRFDLVAKRLLATFAA